MRRFEQALKVLEEGLTREPNNCGLLADMAFCQLELEHLDAVKELAQNILTLNPTYAYAFYLLARVEAQRNQGFKAVEFLNEALALDSTNTDYLAFLALCHSDLNDPIKALEVAERGLALNPQDVNLLNARARGLAAQGQRGVAKETLTNALSFEPNAAMTRNTEGYFALQENDFERARASFLEALRLQPDNTQSRTGLWRLILSRNLTSRLLASLLLWAKPEDWSYSTRALLPSMLLS